MTEGQQSTRAQVSTRRSGLRDRIGLLHARPVIEAGLLFLLACGLILPLFFLEYLENWGSIESTFIADARVLRENLPHPGWYPLWYCGTRFDYIYPPALRYGTALGSLLLHISTARAYHLYIAILYALGIAGVYWLAFTGSRSRLQAWLAALFVALLSPSLVLIPDLLRDSPRWVPQRLHVLISYGEGPHISALSLLGFALAASLAALRQLSAARFIAAGVLCAAVVSNNFYGAVALTVFFCILTWSVWLEMHQSRVWLRAAAIAASAYGLCAFWLTPSYLRVTMMNLRLVALPRSHGSRTLAAACIVFFCAITYLISRRKKNIGWPVFAAGSAGFLAIYVLGAAYYQFTIAGNGMRLAPELDLALSLVFALIIATAWRRPMLRSGVAVVLCLALYPAGRYLSHAWKIYPRAHDIRERPEFTITQWMAAHLPRARALPSGSIRFWYDAWDNNAEADGGSDQGMLNQRLAGARWAILQGADAGITVAWLRALGVDAIIVPGKTSREIYHDFAHPEKFQGVLPVLYDDGQGNTIYSVPRRFPDLARVVDRKALGMMRPLRGGEDLATVAKYVSLIEDGPDAPATVRRVSSDEVEITASTAPGQAVLYQETLDPAWRAYVDGSSARISGDPAGFMLVDTPAGTHTVDLRFEMPGENRVGWALTGATCVILAGLVLFRRRFRPPA